MTNPLAANPAYLAFMRELGIDDAEVAAEVTTATDAIGRQLARRLPRIADAGVREREAISGNFESRGLFRSGQHEVTLARQRADEATDTGDALEAGVDRIAELQTELARRRAGAARKRAEGALSFAPDAYLELA